MRQQHEHALADGEFEKAVQHRIQWRVPAALGGAEFDEPESLHGFGHDLVAGQQAVGDFHPAVGFRADFDRRAEVGVAVDGIDERAFGRAQQADCGIAATASSRGRLMRAGTNSPGLSAAVALETPMTTSDSPSASAFCTAQHDTAERAVGVLEQLHRLPGLHGGGGVRGQKPEPCTSQPEWSSWIQQVMMLFAEDLHGETDLVRQLPLRHVGDFDAEDSSASPR